MIDMFAFEAFDSLFRQISRTFAGSDAREPASELLLGTFALVGVAILAYNIWHRRAQRTGLNVETGVALQPKHIMDILEQVMTHRSRIDLSFHPISAARQSISCSLSDYSKTEVMLELPAGIKPSKNWIGRKMVCFFRIPRENKSPLFYTFITDVSNVHRSGEIYLLALAFPERVELGQKRKHLRLEPLSHDIKDFRLWPATEDSSFHFETDPSKWPKPLAVYSQNRNNDVHVIDISGGGIRLALDPRRYADLNDFVTQHPVLFMSLELQSLDNTYVPPLLLAARLRSKSMDMDLGTLLLGYEFVEFGARSESENIEWVKIEPEKGIEDLASWVFKRHLALYRERENV